MAHTTSGDLDNCKCNHIDDEHRRHLTTESLTTVEQNVQHMESKMEWSRTRKSLFFKCPRAWYLRYGMRRKSSNRRSATFQRPWDLMLRAMKETLLDQLEDVKEGKEWSAMLTDSQLKSSLGNQLSTSVHHISEHTKEALLKFARSRYRLLWRTRMLQQLLKRKHAQWYVFDRGVPILHGIRKLYVSPDLAIRIQNRWHLVRFDMQKSSTNHTMSMRQMQWCYGHSIMKVSMHPVNRFGCIQLDGGRGFGSVTLSNRPLNRYVCRNNYWNMT